MILSSARKNVFSISQGIEYTFCWAVVVRVIGPHFNWIHEFNSYRINSLMVWHTALYIFKNVVESSESVKYFTLN